MGRYGMAIEVDIRDRKVWQSIAQSWYRKAADKTPHVGRLYHHLAILDSADLLEQLFYYCKSLGVNQPFISSRESILTAFDPITNAEVSAKLGQPVVASFVHLHSIAFTHIEFERFDGALDDFLDMLDKHIRYPSRWKVESQLSQAPLALQFLTSPPRCRAFTWPSAI